MRVIAFLSLLCVVLLNACANKGPIGSENFDPSFSDIITQGENIRLFSKTEIRVDTYMESEIKTVSAYEGVLLLTDRGVRFLQWDDDKGSYQSKVEFSYHQLAETKYKFNTLMSSFVALKTQDGHAYGFMLADDMVRQVYDIFSRELARH